MSFRHFKLHLIGTLNANFDTKNTIFGTLNAKSSFMKLKIDTGIWYLEAGIIKVFMKLTLVLSGGQKYFGIFKNLIKRNLVESIPYL